MRWKLWIISIVLSLAPSLAYAEFFQSFTMADGSQILSLTSRESLEFLASRKQAPEFVFQDFGSLVSLVKTSAIFWKPEEVKADELPLTEIIKNYIAYWAEKRELPAKKVLAIANCESRFNPRAKNPKDTDGRPKFGLFQFDRDTFIGQDIWDWKAQTQQATLLMSQEKWRKWPYCLDHWKEYITE